MEEGNVGENYDFLNEWSLLVRRSPLGTSTLPRCDRVLLASAGLREDARGELPAAREAINRYKALEYRLKANGAIIPIKGVEIADRYPHPLVRHQGDLDICATSLEALWAVGAELVSMGFAVDRITLARRDAARIDVEVALDRPDESLPDGVEEVEIGTAYTAGVDGVVQRLSADQAASLRGPIRQLLALADEYTQQPFRLKDVFDASLLVEELDGPSVEMLFDTAAMIGSEDDLQALLSLVAHCRLKTGFDVPAWMASRQSMRSVAGLDFTLRLKRMFRRGAGVLSMAARAPWESLHQNLLFSRDSDRPAYRWVAASTRHLLRADLAWYSGLPIFGIPFSDDVTDQIRLVCMNPQRSAMLFSLPLGTFAFIASDEIPEAELAALRPPIGKMGFRDARREVTI